MSVEIALNTPLADALSAAIISKIGEMALGSGADESSLSEYIILMLVNGKDEAQIASELSTELLGLEADDPGVREFSRWLFNYVRQLNQQFADPSIPMPDHAVFTHGVSHEAGLTEMDTDMSAASPSLEINAPTGPRSMRNGSGNPNIRGGRDKRMLGHINKALDRSHDALHRVRTGSGNERINSHSRGPPTGPRGNNGRLPRSMNNRAASIAHGIVAHGMNGMGGVPQAHAAPGMDGMPNMNGQWGMVGPGQAPQQQFNVMNMLEQQGRIIQELHKQQQMMLSRDQGGRGGFTGRGGRGGFRRGGGGHNNNNQNGRGQQHIDTSMPVSPPEGEDVDMSQGKPPTNPEEMICKFNGRCTNKDCKFAHQTPAVPPTMNVTVDVNDVCSFGAACKNRKCVGRHPSPAARFAHQSEQDCKFYPNCTNPKCPFRHPPPICRNGGDCTVPNCKFTHLQTPCKYNPCTNRFCGYKHEEGQRGTFQDKVWMADSANKEHVSERKFVDENATEETVMMGAEAEMEAIG